MNENTFQTYVNEFVGCALKVYDSGYQFPALNFAFINENGKSQGKKNQTYSTALHLESAPVIIRSILALVKQNAHHFTKEQLDEMGVEVFTI